MTTTKTKVQMHREICEEINDLYARKNHDYGDSFHQTFVEEGMAMARIRLGDKFNRFKTLSRSGEQKVDDESIRDTLIDLANYAIMTVLEMEVAGPDGNKHMVFNWFPWERDNRKEYPKIHPTQKPVGVLKRLIEIFTDPGDVVIDPVAGSGTTLRAAYELGRNAYGFEVDKNFYIAAMEKMIPGKKDGAE